MVPGRFNFADRDGIFEISVLRLITRSCFSEPRVNCITVRKQHHNTVVMIDTLFDRISDDRSSFTHQSRCKLWMLKSQLSAT
jgi:hypothetical protein